MKLKNLHTVQERRLFIERETKTPLKHIGSFTLDEQVASSRHCENMIGAAQIPLGIAGPLTITGKSGKRRTYYIPLATTEGALVASINRGCKVIAENGGATVLVQNVGTTRGPVFKVNSLKEAMALSSYVKQHFETFKKIARETSHRIKLLRCHTVCSGPYVFARFFYNTGDAMGMNMVTFATQLIVEKIERETKIVCLSVAGNFDIDKKPAWLNVIDQRGWKVWGEIVLSRKSIQSVLKTTPKKLYDIWLAKCMVGSALAGSLGFNAHYANVIAALFIATGQDPAHVVEGSLGITSVEFREEDLYISIHLPSLMAGTVGGGTGLATQEEALKMMGVYGTGKITGFCSVIGGAVLAGEISLLASLAEGSLACAHKKLARSSKDR